MHFCQITFVKLVKSLIIFTSNESSDPNLSGNIQNAIEFIPFMTEILQRSAKFGCAQFAVCTTALRHILTFLIFFSNSTIGYYEALDGTCQVVTLHCHQDARDNRTNLERCAGCRLGDRPEGEEGQVELGCLDAEATCMRDFNENAYCREEEKRYICASGYYRAMPENRCYPNAKVQRDKSIPKDGCVDLFRMFFFSLE
jgi:hypothetical protein